HDPLRPLVFRLGRPDQFEYLALKTTGEDLLAVRAKAEEVWRTQFPMRPFEHYFQDDFWAQSIQLTSNIKWFMLIIALVTFLLTVTGLFALISLNALKLNKEIAIRRLFGANLANLALLLNKSYLWIIAAGVLLGCTLGSWLAFQMLNGIYNIHAGMSIPLLVLAAGSTLIVVLVTLGLKMLQVMKTNPADILRQG
ncbi:MAG: FtsX-like permease family protein, partial [Cyanothece sp. SIO1E1]|nr:FtsX-like permease family protein [Cyanothece sp. SIO1E1]